MVRCTYTTLDYLKKVEKVMPYIMENIEKSKDGMIILKLYDVIEKMGTELTSESLPCQMVYLGQALYEEGIHRYFKDKLRKITPEDIFPTEELYKNEWIMLWSK